MAVITSSSSPSSSSSSAYNILHRESKKVQNDNPIQTLTSIIPSTLHAPTYRRLFSQLLLQTAASRRNSPALWPAHYPFRHFIKHPSGVAAAHTSMDSATDEAIMAALLRLNNPQLLHSLAAELRLRHRRLLFLLLSPPHFSLALSHLRSLSLRSKTLLLARLLLRSLSLLQSPLRRPHRLCLRDFDAGVLLLAMCDSYDPSSAVPGVDWRALIADRLATDALSTAGLGGGWWPVIAAHVDAAAKCRRLVEALKDTSASGGAAAAAAAAAVMSLAVAEIGECAICGEEIVNGGTMPCGHPFHWLCIMEWLRMRNSCPCCRFELPTEDIYSEIQRVWKMILKMGG